MFPLIKGKKGRHTENAMISNSSTELGGGCDPMNLKNIRNNM